MLKTTSKFGKLPARIRIIADKPGIGQDSIADWIGKEFSVSRWLKDENNKPDGRVHVKFNDGSYIIQPGEYELI